MTQALMQYSYLQVLDFLTTIAFLLNGIREGNPVVRLALQHGSTPLTGLFAVKVIGVALGVYCWRFGRQRLLERANILFAVLVVWNIAALIAGSLARG